MMNWLPDHPDFRSDLRIAVDTADPDTCIEKLSVIARYNLDYLEIIQLERALGQVTAGKSTKHSTVRLAILASSTVDQLVPAIRVAGLRRNTLINVYVGQYGQYRQELLDPTSPLHEYNPEFVLFSLTAHEAIAGIPLNSTAHEIDALIDRSVNELRALWMSVREKLDATVIQQTYLNIAEPVFGSYDRLVKGTPKQLVASLNNRLSEAAAMDNVLLLDIARASEYDGLGFWFDNTRWLQAKLAISPEASSLYGDLAVRLIAAQRGLSKKCLVLDLDNTLWGGVIGDDGLDGIILGEGSALGEAHLALQRYVKNLKERGVILAVCSKNDPDTAASVFEEHPDMILEKSDFAAFVANWEDKAANLRSIAAQLNIGIESLVFIDDNPVERARIRKSLPMVAVPELPDNPAQYVHSVANAGYFEAISFTVEDQQRADQYEANASRQAFLDSAQSLDEFLCELDMCVIFSPVRSVDIKRVAQLINKTNQFNTTTRRYTAEEVTSFVNQDDCIVLQFRLTDKFGDNGIVSVMILRPDSENREIFDIDTWVMSCRVFGRQLENEIMNIAVEAARQKGNRSVRADYIPTAKNKVIRELYPGLGFRQVKGTDTDDDTTRWELELSDYVNQETHITRRSK